MINPQNAPGGGDGTKIIFQNTADSGRRSQIEGYSNNNYGQDNGLRFLTQDGLSTPRTVLDLRGGAAGDVKVSIGNLVIGTSGKGIDFSATAGTGTSELLDDYEEGTWTPAFTGSDSGTSTQTVVAATYTKIGRAVHVTCYLTAVNLSSVLGASINLTGLPFACSSFQHFTAGYSSLFTFDEEDIGVSGYTTNGSTSCTLFKGSSTTSINATTEATTTSGVIMITFTYQTDA